VDLSYITFENVVKEYRSGENAVLAVDDVSFGIERGELCVVLGPSGAGKTTVLNLLGGMERVTSGCIRAGGREVTSFGERELTAYRREDVGFVFQFYNLMPNLTALENVELAKQICKNPLDPVEVLEQVGLLDRMNNFPAQLSGGEQQRVSIARALCKNPTLLLCDEPTGALDSRTGMQVLRLLSDVSAKYGTTVIIITHNTLIASMAKRVIRMKNGRIESVVLNKDPMPVEEIAW
jgi:putative ABC transport system ATP-binding protein